MTARFELCIDCCDPEGLAPFWMAALGYGRGEGEGRPYINLRPPDGRIGPVVFLQRVPEAKTVKNRLHIDLYDRAPQEVADRLEALGARRIGLLVTDSSGTWNFQLMADPEGNEFCVCQDPPARPADG